MSLLLDSFWRAVAYCLHPRVVVLSLLPLVVMVAVAAGLGWLYWDDAINAVFIWLESSKMLTSVANWLQNLGLGGLKNALAPLIVIFAATPLIVVAVLLLVGILMAPAIVNLVARRRYPHLERRRGASFLGSIAWALGSTALALFAFAVSLPLWLIPPLILVVPPLIWGWLSYRVMAFDALAEHASAEERHEILRRHRMQFVAMGIVTGYLGAAPSLVWASAWIFAAAFVLLIPVAIWIYTLVFALSSLWFAHYGLAALELLRREEAARAGVPAPPGQVGWTDDRAQPL